MRNKKWVSLLALLTMLSACSDDTYKGTEQKELDDDTTPVPVLLSLGSATAIETKGVGAIEELGGEKNPFIGSKVFIYSFKQQQPGDANGYFESANMVGESENLKDPDCLINDGDIGYGKEAVVNANSTGNIDWTSAPTTVFFPSSKDVAYDFFGYYLDDLKPLDGSISRTQDAISFKVEIDGSQDLMSAKASFVDPTSDSKYNKDYETPWNALSETEKQNVKKYAFGSYTARRGIQPILHFKHHLVRLNFDIYGGAPDSTVEITSLVIEKCPYVATFTVAAKDGGLMGLTFDEAPMLDYALRDSITLEEGKTWEETNHNLPQILTPFTIPKGKGESDNPYNNLIGRLGAGLLLPKPLLEVDAVDESGKSIYGYKCVITMRQIVSVNPDTNEPVYKIFSTETLLNVKKDGMIEAFKESYEYTVRIAVYGLKTVNVTVEPEGWQSGGSIDVDEDEISN